MTLIKVSYYSEQFHQTVQTAISKEELSYFKQNHKYVDIVGTVKPFDEKAVEYGLGR